MSPTRRWRCWTGLALPRAPMAATGEAMACSQTGVEMHLYRALPRPRPAKDIRRSGEECLLHPSSECRASPCHGHTLVCAEVSPGISH